jgi:hypothetical protein
MRCVLALVPLALAACSTTTYMRDAEPTPPPGDDEAKVIVYRTAAFGGSENFPVYELVDNEGKLLGFTETDRYFEYRCPPGRHLFVTWAEGEAFIEADLEAGRTYFIRAYSKFGVLAPRPGFAPVGQGSENWDKLDEILSPLQCRELDPTKAAEYEQQKEEQFRKTLARYEEGKKESRHLAPGDGKADLSLPAK